MLVQLRTGDVSAFCDNANTLSHMREPKTCADIDHPRAYLWSRFALEVTSSWTFHKTKAHATLDDVAQDRTTEWERKGNNKADELAKRGVLLHGITEQMFDQYRALHRIAWEAGKWAAEQEVMRAQWKWPDLPDDLFVKTAADDFQEPLPMEPPPLSFRGRVPMQSPADALNATAEAPVHMGHPLFTGDVCAAPDSGTATTVQGLLCCLQCGAYSTGRAGALQKDCAKNRGRPGLSVHQTRLMRGRFPQSKFAEWRVTNFRPASQNQAQWLQRDAKGIAPNPIDWDFQLARHAEHEAGLLRFYGATESSLVSWIYAMGQRCKGWDKDQSDSESDD